MAETTHLGEGQLECNNTTYIPSLKQFLFDFNIPDNVYVKLKSESIDWNTLIHIENDELGILCDQVLNLQFTLKIKFKAAIKQLQLQYKLKAQQQQNHIHITTNEQQQLNKITAAEKQATDIQILFQNHLNQVQDHVNTIESSINKEFEQITNRIQKRKQLLHKNVEEWKLKRFECINREIAQVCRYKQGIISVHTECKELLKNNDNINLRENKIKAMTLQICDNDLYDNSNILQYIVTNTKLIDIKLEPMNNIDTHGKIISNVQNPLINLPVINLYETIAVHASQYKNGYKIRLKWDVSIPQNNIKHFTIKYKEHLNNDNDEKKIIFDEKAGEDEWIISEYNIIKITDNNTKFEVDIINNFEYNQQYQYQILLNVLNPIAVIIKSNIIPSMITNIVQLKLHSFNHRAHYFSKAYHPQQMLNSSGQGYGSAFVNNFKPNETDWVVFKLGEDGLCVPKKFVIKCFGNAQTVKTMRVLIGNGMKKWYLFNPNSINVEKNNKYQTFEINGVDETIIKNNELIYIKLELLTNHGCKSGCKFFIYEFQLYGIKLE